MMKPERIKLDYLLQSAGDSLCAQLADEITKGAIFVYPTETIYGIGGNTNLPSVGDKIFEAKHRPAENPMIYMASKPEEFSSLNLRIPAAAQALINAFWPGQLTVVLPVKDGHTTIAVRVSSHPFLNKLYRYISFPIYSTSANTSGKPYNPDPDYIFDTFTSKVDFMIDAGFLPPSLPSSVVSVDGMNNVKIIREGVVTKASIHQVLERL